MQREIDAAQIINAEPDWTRRVYGQQPFAGAGKTNSGFLVPLERRLTAFVLPRIPRWLETYPLTLFTPVWSVLIVVFGYMAARDLRWLGPATLITAVNSLPGDFTGKLGRYWNS